MCTARSGLSKRHMGEQASTNESAQTYLDSRSRYSRSHTLLAPPPANQGSATDICLTSTNVGFPDPTKSGALKAIDEPAIRTIAKLRHDILETYQITDVNRWFVLKGAGVGGRIEIEEMAWPALSLHVRQERGAERRFSRARWAYDAEHILRNNQYVESLGYPCG